MEPQYQVIANKYHYTRYWIKISNFFVIYTRVYVNICIYIVLCRFDNGTNVYSNTSSNIGGRCKTKRTDTRLPRPNVARVFSCFVFQTLEEKLL